MTSTNPAVNTVSRISAPTSVMPVPGFVIPSVTACWLTATRTMTPAAIAPMIWATM